MASLFQRAALLVRSLATNNALFQSTIPTIRSITQPIVNSTPSCSISSLTSPHWPALNTLLPFAARTATAKARDGGGKTKFYTAYKRRFKITGGGKILYSRPGYVHKRTNKSRSRLFRLAKEGQLSEAYANIMKKLNFKLRRCF